MIDTKVNGEGPGKQIILPLNIHIYSGIPGHAIYKVL